MTAKETANTQSGAPLALIVNGEQMLARASTLAMLISEAGYGDAKLATAVNGTFIPQHKRAETTLANGDRIEILSPRQGG